MSQQFNHFHIKIDDVAESIEAIDEEKLKRVSEMWASLANSMVKVHATQESRVPGELSRWAGAIAGAFVSGTIVIGCIWGIVWVLVQVRMLMG